MIITGHILDMGARMAVCRFLINEEIEKDIDI